MVRNQQILLTLTAKTWSNCLKWAVFKSQYEKTQKNCKETVPLDSICQENGTIKVASGYCLFFFRERELKLEQGHSFIFCSRRKFFFVGARWHRNICKWNCMCLPLSFTFSVYFFILPCISTLVRLIPLPYHAMQLLHTYYPLWVSEYSATFSGAHITLHSDGQPGRLVSLMHPVQALNLEQDNSHIKSHKELLLCSQICEWLLKCS